MDKTKRRNEMNKSEINKGISITIVPEAFGLPFEYFCQDCSQLRLCLDPELNACKNCGGSRIIKGNYGSLDKDNLKKKFKSEGGGTPGKRPINYKHLTKNLKRSKDYAKN
jgi:DNA-directed RNA polymerase subunit RPC12/RpoP